MSRDIKAELEAELAPLKEKVEKLHTFLGREDAETIVGAIQYFLLEIQYNAMNSYKEILELRIEDLS